MSVEKIMGEIPATFDEAVTRCKEIIDQECPIAWDEENLESFMGALHHGLGTHIRNYWSLWQEKGALYDDMKSRFNLSHADDLSGLILLEAYTSHNNLPSEIEAQVQRYLDHWAKING